ncbi:hypothetical protein PLICRDRAFT_118149, partial [Plicaturopsis crispa FD-325 SS-3]
GCIERAPDIYLSELQDELEGTCAVRVDVSTIWRALTRRGFTRKKVKAMFAWQVSRLFIH